jgi:hypothetical protein
MALYGLAWFVTAQVLRNQVAAWLDVQRHDGVAVTTGGWETRGFPGRVHLVARDVAAGTGESGWTWRAPEIHVRAWPLGIWWLNVELTGRQTLAGAFTPPLLPMWLEADKLQAKLRLDLTGRLRKVDVITTALSAGVADTAPVMHLGHGHVAIHLLRPAPKVESAETSPTLPATSRWSGELVDLGLPDVLPAPFNQPVARIAGTVEVTGPISDGPLPQVLETWRTAGGTVEVKDALLEWPPLKVVASGSFALDQRLQPMGAASARIQGSGDAVEALAKTGWMGPEEAAVAQLALGAMSQRSEDGAASELNVPLTVQDRRLFAGPVTVLELPEIEWRRAVVP